MQNHYGMGKRKQDLTRQQSFYDPRNLGNPINPSNDNKYLGNWASQDPNNPSDPNLVYGISLNQNPEDMYGSNINGEEDKDKFQYGSFFRQTQEDSEGRQGSNNANKWYNPNSQDPSGENKDSSTRETGNLNPSTSNTSSLTQRLESEDSKKQTIERVFNSRSLPTRKFKTVNYRIN